MWELLFSSYTFWQFVPAVYCSSFASCLFLLLWVSSWRTLAVSPLWGCLAGCSTVLLLALWRNSFWRLSWQTVLVDQKRLRNPEHSPRLTTIKPRKNVKEKVKTWAGEQSSYPLPALGAALPILLVVAIPNLKQKCNKSDTSLIENKITTQKNDRIAHLGTGSILLTDFRADHFYVRYFVI